MQNMKVLRLLIFLSIAMTSIVIFYINKNKNLYKLDTSSRNTDERVFHTDFPHGHQGVTSAGHHQSTKSTHISHNISYEYFDKYSKRYNISKDVRPENILKQSGNFNNTRMFDEITHVPHIFHQTGKTDTVLFLYKAWMKSLLKYNPEWEYWYWTDEDLNRFINIRYPDFKKVFFGYKHGVQRSDVFRYFVMYEFGGIYADLDMECLKPLENKMAENDCMMSLEPPVHSVFMYKDRSQLVSNAFMACRPRHSFFKYVIDNLTKGERHTMKDAVRSTGPIMLDNYYNEMLQKVNASLPYLPDAELYQPSTDPRDYALYVRQCRYIMFGMLLDQFPKTAKRTCEALLSRNNRPTNLSYTTHHFTHSYLSAFVTDKHGQKSDPRTFNVKDLFR